MSKEGEKLGRGSLGVSANLSFTGTAKPSVKHHLSYNHLTGAAALCGECGRLERDYPYPAPDEILDSHMGKSIGAVILSASAVEATVNEVYQEAVDKNARVLGNLLPVSSVIVSLWDTVERAPTLRRFQWLLTVAGLAVYEVGAKPYQQVADLFELRNELVHWKPKVWTPDETPASGIEIRLRGKFELNKLSAQSHSFLPHKCLGYGCGQWAVKVAFDFITDFYDRIGSKITVAHLWPRMEKLMKVT